MRDWNHELGQPRNRLRVVVPVNLRNRSDLAMSAANRLSYSFLTRSERQMRSSERLLSSIGRETSTLRRNGTALELLKKLRLLQQTGRFYPWVFTPQRCFATAVFSNLGDPTRRFRIRFPRRNGLVQVGNMTLTSFAGTTALRPQTHAGFFFNTYAHQLTISTRFDPAYFTVEDANHFLERLADRLGVSSTPVVTSDRAAA